MSDIAIKENTVASVHYRGTLTKNGEEFDNSEGREPLTFMVGFRQMIPGFEAALMGKTAGEKVKFDLTAEQAYGERDSEAVQVVPLDQLPDGVKVGDQLAAETPDGHVIPLSVTSVSEESATLDMNHELAGEGLTFEVEVIEVREATEEEVSHGHVHGPGGHHH
jgi:FKBP-type peptidyl-prolyl cis-trans isomerase SlyD